jgi:probable HAF family extracellular repeat protein
LGVPPGDTSAIAYGINDQGQVVGSSFDQAAPFPRRAVLWQDDRAILLDSLPGHTGSEAFAINDAGLIVGWSDRDAVMWRLDRSAR